jgi:hypothetical protein
MYSRTFRFQNPLRLVYEQFFTQIQARQVTWNEQKITKFL